MSTALLENTEPAPAVPVGATTPRRRRWGLPRGKHGWVGVDCGAGSIKLAQVVRRADGYGLAAAWQIPLSADSATSPAGRLCAELAPRIPELTQARRMFRGRNAAATTPSSLTEFRCLELPRGTRDELRQMVDDELHHDASRADNDDAQRCFDFWEEDGSRLSTDAMAQLMVVDVARSTAQTLSESLRSAHFDCRTIDGAPCALARAIALADPRLAEQPVVAIDLGWSSTFIVAAERGRPLKLRVVRNCGLNSLAKPLESTLKLSLRESSQLLRQLGISPGLPANGVGASAQAMHDLLAAPLGRLIGEIRKTLSFWEHARPPLVPTEIMLFGGGALVKRMPEFIANEVHLPVRAWSMVEHDSAQPRQDAALFGVAAALSALAWSDD